MNANHDACDGYSAIPRHACAGVGHIRERRHMRHWPSRFRTEWFDERLLRASKGVERVEKRGQRKGDN